MYGTKSIKNLCIRDWNNLKSIVCTPPPPHSAEGGWGWGVEPPTKFSERGDLTGSQLLEGDCWESDFFRGVAIFT